MHRLLNIVSLRNRTAGRRGSQNVLCDKRDRAITCMFWCDLHLTLMFSGLKESELWPKVISNEIIVTLVTQGLPSSFLSSPVA